MKLVITGGAGFIGSNLARLALKAGHSVVVVDDFSTGSRANIQDLELEVRQETILDDKALGSALKGAEAVVHLAALGSVPRSINDPVRTHHVNATGSLNVLRASYDAGVNHVSVASSSSVYGLNPALPKGEREWTRPMSPYAVSKLATEQYALAFQQSYGLKTLAFRFFNVFGLWQRAGHPYAAVVPVFMDHLLRGDRLPINGDGSNSRDFTYVETVCKVLLESSERQLEYPEPVNLAFGTNTTLLELVKRMGEVTGKAPEIEYREPRPGDVKHSQADNTTLRSLFPSISPVSLEEGLMRTYEWFEKEYK